MKNQEKGFSQEPVKSVSKAAITPEEKEVFSREFEVMQRLDFAFIKEIGATNAEEYIIGITRLKYARANRHKHVR